MKSNRDYQQTLPETSQNLLPLPYTYNYLADLPATSPVVLATLSRGTATADD